MFGWGLPLSKPVPASTVLCPIRECLKGKNLSKMEKKTSVMNKSQEVHEGLELQIMRLKCKHIRFVIMRQVSEWLWKHWGLQNLICIKFSWKTFEIEKIVARWFFKSTHFLAKKSASQCFPKHYAASICQHVTFFYFLC